jgi:hypothetical protein
MNKKIEDYLHLYLGCEVKVLDIDGQTFTDKVESVHDNKSGKGFSIYEFGDCPFDNHEEYYQRIMPILRPLSDMTEEERIECKAESTVRFAAHSMQYEKLEPDQFIKLLSKGFDLFNLIPEGLAIDKTSLLTNQVK